MMDQPTGMDLSDPDIGLVGMLMGIIAMIGFACFLVGWMFHSDRGLHAIALALFFGGMIGYLLACIRAQLVKMQKHAIRQGLLLEAIRDNTTKQN